LLLAGVLGLSVGCAGQSYTPIQELTWTAVKECERSFPEVRFDGRIDPDGRWWRRGHAERLKAFDECVMERRAALSRQASGTANPRDLILRARFIAIAPPAGYLATAPEGITQFKIDTPVTFYLNMKQSGRVFQGKFKWYGPDGALVLQQDRVLREPKDSSYERVWHIQVLPSAQVQQLGLWTMELYVDNQRMDRYEFTVIR
jgi:hypothetical protein